MTAATHVVFGTGPAGRAVATALVDQGARVRMVNRSGKAVIGGVETTGGDATDPAFARDAVADAETVYFCLNAPNYHGWAEEFPPLQHAVVGAAKAVHAKLVVLENLYMYGPTVGPLRETTPINPTSSKSRTRATMSAELLEAHRRGDVRVVIGRAADFVGPGVRDSALGEFVFEPALAGKRAQTMGRPDTPHTYSYVPDVGRNLVLLSLRDDAYGRAWHLPTPETRTTRQIILDVYAASGTRRTSVTTLKRPVLEPSDCSTAMSASSCIRTTSSRRRSSSTTQPSKTPSAATRRAGTRSSPRPSTGTALKQPRLITPTASPRPQP
jgi:nucleoside-diphosphate-sugar epimerase